VDGKRSIDTYASDIGPVIQELVAIWLYFETPTIGRLERIFQNHEPMQLVAS